MTGTKAGGKQASITNRSRYGEDFYVKLGEKGGRASNTGGFQKGSALAREAGRKGGRISKRKGTPNVTR